MLGLLGAVLLVAVDGLRERGWAAARAGHQTAVGRRRSTGPGREPQAPGARGPCRDVLLALAGGVGGLVIAVAATPLIVALSPADVPRLEFVAVNSARFAFAAGVSVLVAFASALAPISLAGRRSLADVSAACHSTCDRGRHAHWCCAGRGRDRDRRHRGRRGRTRRPQFRQAEPGAAWISRRIGCSRSGLRRKASDTRRPPRVSAFYQQLLERVRSEPGVASAGAITIRPLWSTVGYDSPFTLEGQSEPDARRNPHLNFMAVSADYFRTMGIPLRQGRVFTDRDATGQPGVAVVGESLAARVWPGQNAIGKRLIAADDGHASIRIAWLTVVGVVADARYRELHATRLDFYLSHLQADTPLGYLVVRAAGEPTALTPGDSRRRPGARQKRRRHRSRVDGSDRVSSAGQPALCGDRVRRSSDSWRSRWPRLACMACWRIR